MGWAGRCVPAAVEGPCAGCRCLGVVCHANGFPWLCALCGRPAVPGSGPAPRSALLDEKLRFDERPWHAAFKAKF